MHSKFRKPLEQDDEWMELLPCKHNFWTIWRLLETKPSVKLAWHVVSDTIALTDHLIDCVPSAWQDSLTTYRKEACYGHGKPSISRALPLCVCVCVRVAR